MTTPGRRPSNIRYRQSRQLELLLKAGQVFSEIGYDSANMEALAHSLEVTKATLYSYFRSKAELFEAVMANWTSELPILKPTPPTSSSLREQLSWIAEEVVRQETQPAAIAISRTLARSVRPPSIEGSIHWNGRRNRYQAYVERALASLSDCDYPGIAAQQFLLLIHESLDLIAADASNTRTAETRLVATVDIFVRAFASRPSNVHG